MAREFSRGLGVQEFLRPFGQEDRLVRDPDGEQSYWTNPGDPRNLDLEYRAMMELVEKYDLDGIHFDYIRYPDAPHYNFDYGEISRREFQKATGLTVKLWPDDVLSGPLKLAYEGWERENINRLVKRVYVGVKQVKPHVHVSAAVWRNHRRYYTVIKQDWPRWVEKGWLDFVVPMDYYRRGDSFAKTVDAQVAVVRGKIPLAAGIGNWLLGPQEQLLDFVKITRDHGADGFVLFSYNADHIEQHLSALKAGATSLPAKPAYRSPRFELNISNATVKREDQPTAVEVGQRLSVNIRLVRHTSRRKYKRITGAVRWEDLSGALVAQLAAFDSSNGREAVAAAEAPAGLFRPAIRGNISFDEGGEESFAFCGPVFEGMPREAIAELKQREQPPKLSGEGLHIGVYADGLGADALIEGLKTEEGITPFPLYRLRPDHLAVGKVIILPQLKDVSDLSYSAISALREWTAKGGKLILTHGAAGFRWHPRMLSEVGQDIARIKEKTVVAATDIPGVEKGCQFEHSFSDHIRLNAEDAGRVLVTEDDSDVSPVVVGAMLGEGIGILCGLIAGYGGEEGLSDDERRLLVGLIHWVPGSE